jgi:hypothetical protein
MDTFRTSRGRNTQTFHLRRHYITDLLIKGHQIYDVIDALFRIHVRIQEGEGVLPRNSQKNSKKAENQYEILSE